jgi:hypothetical protein
MLDHVQNDRDGVDPGDGGDILGKRIVFRHRFAWRVNK